MPYNDLDEISNQAHLDEGDGSESDPLDETFVPRSRAKAPATSPRQTRARTKSITPAIDVDSQSDSQSEPDVGAMREDTQYSDADSNPVTQSRTRRRDPTSRNPKRTSTYVSRQHTKAHDQATSSRQMRVRTKSLSPAIESDNLVGNEGETEYVDSELELDVGLMREETQYYDAESTPLVPQKCGSPSSNTSERTPTPTPSPVIDEDQPTLTPAAPIASREDTATEEDRVASSLVNSNGSYSRLGRVGGQVDVCPGNSRQDKLENKTAPSTQQGASRLKRKPLITLPRHDPQVEQQTDSMEVDEPEPQGLEMNPNKRHRGPTVITEKSHRLYERGKTLAMLRDKNRKLVRERQELLENEKAEKEALRVDLREEQSARTREQHNTKKTIQTLTLQVKKLEAQTERERELSELSAKQERVIGELNARLEERDADIKGLHLTIAQNDVEILDLKTQLGEHRIVVEHINFVEQVITQTEAEMGLRDSEIRQWKDAFGAIEIERDELRVRINKEKKENDADVQNLLEDIKALQQSREELRDEVLRYHNGREDKIKEVAHVRRELEEVRQKLKTVLESARGKEAELKAEIERYRKASNEEAKEIEDIEPDVAEEQKLQEELEHLKGEYACAMEQKNQEIAALRLRKSRRTERTEQQDAETQSRSTDEEQYQPSSVPKSRRPSSSSQRTKDLLTRSTREHREPVVSPLTKLPPVKSSAATHTRNASPPPRLSGGTPSTSSPQAGSSRSALPRFDLREAKQIRDAKLEKMRKQAESLGRRRGSAMPEMRMPDVTSTAHPRGRKTTEDNTRRIPEKDFNAGNARKGRDPEPLLSAAGTRMLKQAVKDHISENTVKKKSYARRANLTKATVEQERSEDTQEVRLMFCYLVRGTVLNAFGLDKTDEYVLLSAADRALVEEYNNLNRGDGPNIFLPEIDMDGRISSPWNVTLIKLLAEEAMTALENVPGLSALPSRSPAYYEALVKDQIERARTAWRKAQPQKLADGKEETLEETRKRLTDASDKREKSVRRTSRRIARYKRRLDDVRIMIRLSKIEKAADLFIWEWLEQLILNLSPMGMSSDDTEYEQGTLQKKYAIRLVPWRERVFAPMEKIDSLRKPGGPLEKTKGATAEPRARRRDAPSTNRDPPTGLTEDVFYPRWLEKNGHRYPLAFSKKKFKFLDYGHFS